MSSELSSPAATWHDGGGRRGGGVRERAGLRSLDGGARDVAELHFTVSELSHARRLVASAAERAGLDEERSEDLKLAVNELASNSVCHGGGGGTLRVWLEEGSLVCEVRDRGFIEEPWLRHVRPGPDHFSGRGLWLVDQLCDLVQIRSSQEFGSTVRVYMRTA